MAAATIGDIAARVRPAVEARAAELVDLTTSFLEIASENPPGAGLPEAQAWILGQLDGYGISCDVVESGEEGDDHRIIVGHVGDDGPVMYLHGHYDVVPAFGSHQFSPEIGDGKIVGRGASDMKSGLVAMLLAALVHRSLGGAGRIELIYVPDEETGGAAGAERLVELGVVNPEAPTVGAIVGEPSWPDIWYAARGAFTVNVVIRGRPAHVGLHYKGSSAFEHGHAVLGELFAYRDSVAARRTAFRIEPEAARSSIMLIGGVSGGGTNFNIVPDEFSFTIDRRPNPDEDYASAKDELLGLLDDLGKRFDLTVHVLQDAVPAETPLEAPLVEALEESVALTPGRHAALAMCPGCLETRVYTREGIPAVAYGPGPAAVMHGPDENVPIANLTEACLAYAATLGALLGYA
jgi:acetylornithine deacetylase/succinyl-diaminopimelate desuccinylase family protein